MDENHSHYHQERQKGIALEVFLREVIVHWN